MEQLTIRQDQINEALKKCQEAYDSLKSLSSGSEEYSIHVDAIIKRFETLFEYVWKFLKAAAEYQGMEAPGPRPAIQEAIRFGWLSNPELWADALDARNGSVHDYFGISTKEYLTLISTFLTEVRDLIPKVSTAIGMTPTPSNKK